MLRTPSPISRVLLALVTTSFALCESNPVMAVDETPSRETRLQSILERVGARVLGDSLDEPARMLSRSIRARRTAHNHQDVAEWRKLETFEQWERFRDRRIALLRQSLGQFPDPPDDLHVRITRTHRGDGFQVDCLVFESRPGLLVTANRYRPSEPSPSMPGILICHSHHNPKTQGELQDMGMTWARQGCVVLVMDQLGHGERRQHPFRTEADYDGEFRPSRQDYYFRYNVGMQLHLIGDSLIGWMVWDLSRGVDLLLRTAGVDPARIVLLGAVAGGGDPASVTAALDKRITAVVPFNFGGPQPENTFPLPADAELSFNYIGGGSWESTRNLRLSARDGFLPWVIVGSVAPRRLIYAHEFSWDREHDPVWKRLETLFEWSGQREHLASVLGYGKVTMSSAEASHCNNIGPHHRQQIYPALRDWFQMPMPEVEYQSRFDSSELLCVEGVESASDITLPRVHELARTVADERLAQVRDQLEQQPAGQRSEFLARKWAELLGMPEQSPAVKASEPLTQSVQGLAVVKTTLETETGVFVPVVLLIPQSSSDSGCAAVVAVSQSGKAEFLKRRRQEIAGLLGQGMAVCLPDLRGTGETRPGDYRGRRSDATGLSSNELMLGRTLVGSRLSDLLSVLRWLRAQPQLDGQRIVVWGDSFAEPNGPDRNVRVPLDASAEPSRSEPLGPTLALLASVFDQQVRGVVSRNGLVSLRSLLGSQFVHVPHDFIVPGALTAGELSDLGRTILASGRAVLVQNVVDGENRRVTDQAAASEWGELIQSDADVVPVIHAILRD